MSGTRTGLLLAVFAWLAMSTGVVHGKDDVDFEFDPVEVDEETDGWDEAEASRGDPWDEEESTGVDPEDDSDLDDPEAGETSSRAVRRVRRRAGQRRGKAYFRAGMLHVMANAKSDEVVLTGVDGPATLAVENGPIEGSSATMDDLTIMAAIVGYAVPAGSGELAVETVLAAPVTMQLKGEGTIAEESIAPMALGSIPTGVPPLGAELGETKALPPIVTVVFRSRRGKRLRPYAGVGASYLYTYDSKITNPAMTEIVAPDLEIDNAMSWVGQLGIDAHIAGRVYATFDVKYLTGYAVSAKVSNINMRTPAFPLYESVYVGNVSVDVDVKPVIVTAGAGMSF